MPLHTPFLDTESVCNPSLTGRLGAGSRGQAKPGWAMSETSLQQTEICQHRESRALSSLVSIPSTGRTVPEEVAGTSASREDPAVRTALGRVLAGLTVTRRRARWRVQVEDTGEKRISFGVTREVLCLTSAG